MLWRYLVTAGGPASALALLLGAALNAIVDERLDPRGMRRQRREKQADARQQQAFAA